MERPLDRFIAALRRVIALNPYRVRTRCTRTNPHLSHVTGADGSGYCPGLRSP